MGDGVQAPSTLGVASETSAVAGRGVGHSATGRRLVARRPGPLVHALTSDGSVLCGAQVGGLLLWPGWEFGDIPGPDRCPACRALAA